MRGEGHYVGRRWDWKCEGAGREEGLGEDGWIE